MSAGYSALIVKLRGSRRNIAMAVSFTTDIRPLFRDSPDIDTMQGFGIDLSSYD